MFNFKKERTMFDIECQRVSTCIEANNDGGTFDRPIRIFDPVSGYRGLENFPKLPFCCHFIDRVRIRIQFYLNQRLESKYFSPL